MLANRRAGLIEPQLQGREEFGMGTTCLPPLGSSRATFGRQIRNWSEQVLRDRTTHAARHPSRNSEDEIKPNFHYIYF